MSGQDATVRRNILFLHACQPTAGDVMNALIDGLNTIFWGYILIYGLLAVGVFFTIRLGALQFLHFGEMVRSLLGARESDKSGISPFQALCTSLASRVGTGNIAGVAVALYLGGAGAIFWMWMVALVGMATAYAESTLAQLYKVRDGEGQYRGGPAFYLAKGLKAPWAGSIFSVCLILSFGLVFNAVQANSIADAMEGAFGFNKLMVGIAVAAVAALVIFGGLRSIARFAEFVVPFMAAVYVLMALVVLAMNYSDVPGVLATIVKSAFGLEEAAGGVAGSVTAAMWLGCCSDATNTDTWMSGATSQRLATRRTPAARSGCSWSLSCRMAPWSHTSAAHVPRLQSGTGGKVPSRMTTSTTASGMTAASRLPAGTICRTRVSPAAHGSQWLPSQQSECRIQRSRPCRWRPSAWWSPAKRSAFGSSITHRAPQQSSATPRAATSAARSARASSMTLC